MADMSFLNDRRSANHISMAQIEKNANCTPGINFQAITMLLFGAF